MFDIFGMSKVDAREAIQEMMCGCTRGLLEGYEFKLDEKQREIDRLKEKMQDDANWERRYNELLSIVDIKRKAEAQLSDNKDTTTLKTSSVS